MIIWVTIGGNTPLAARGPDILCPSFIFVLAPRTAEDMTKFPIALEDTCNASKIGTPLLIRVPSILVNLETAVFLLISPIIGARNLNLSRLNLPLGVLL